MKKHIIPALLNITPLLLAALGVAATIFAPLPAQAKPTAAVPGRIVVYTIKQFSHDGKPMGEWKTRYGRPSATPGGCIQWRPSADTPVNELCGGILQVTGEVEQLLTHQKQ